MINALDSSSLVSYFLRLVQPRFLLPNAAEWSVPPELLARPSREELRSLDRDAYALLFDRHLRVLARQEASCRRVLGRLAGAFLRTKGHHRLGFARLGDWTRERLGISARELQSIARVASKFEALPTLARAFETGELSWTQARLLIDVATPESEAAWIAVARDLTVRALANRIRSGEAPVPRHPTRDDAMAVATRDDEDDGSTIDGEPAVRIRIACPRRLRALWRSTIELARRMTGEPLPLWEACEAIAAEGLSSPDARCAASDHGRGDPPGAASCTTASRDCLDSDADRHRVERRADAFSQLDWATIEAAIPERVAALACGIEALDALALDGRLRATLESMHRIHWQTGRLLRLVFDLRLYRWLGFATAERYVQERLGIGIRTAQGLVAVERVTWRAPRLGAAYERGTISPLRALIIAPVLSETHEATWLARANEVTVRRLSDEVTWALNVQDVRPLCEPVAPPAAGLLVMPSEAQMRARFDDETPDVVISVRAPASVAALFETAIAAFTRAGKPRWRGFERLLAHVRAEWNAQPRHRDPIFARDSWRCAVPACSSRRNLHDHHVMFRSRGGGNQRDNRIAICAAHHQHGLHGGGYVRAWGEAPDGIHWELGIRQHASPLLTLIGDRYVSDS
ncbi:MAG: HNH endonuclease [Deltaproteobacteria bacterium]|nr:HNH endonuclease [Deltaproteobacteria bacterium]